MRFLLLIFFFSLGLTNSAQAQQFAVSKSKFQQCVNKIKPSDKLFRAIGDECAFPAVESECRYGGKNSRSIYGDCPPELVSQMSRWIKQESAQIRKLGGKQASEAKKLLNNIGDAKNVCRTTSDTGRVMDGLNFSFCRSIVLTQTYGMLYFIKTRMK